MILSKRYWICTHALHFIEFIHDLLRRPFRMNYFKMHTLDISITFTYFAWSFCSIINNKIMNKKHRITIGLSLAMLVHIITYSTLIRNTSICSGWFFFLFTQIFALVHETKIKRRFLSGEIIENRKKNVEEFAVIIESLKYLALNCLHWNIFVWILSNLNATNWKCAKMKMFSVEKYFYFLTKATLIYNITCFFLEPWIMLKKMPVCTDTVRLWRKPQNKSINKQMKVFQMIKLTSYMGSLSEFHCDMRSTLRSTTVTRMFGHFNAMTLHVGPPTYPAPMQHIFVMTILTQIKKKNNRQLRLLFVHRDWYSDCRQLVFRSRLSLFAYAVSISFHTLPPCQWVAYFTFHWNLPKRV